MSHKQISESLDIAIDEDASIIEEVEIVRFQSGTLKPTDQDIADDYNFARQTLRDLVEKGSEALGEAIKLTKESPQPRTIEVTATLINQVASVSKDLLSLSKVAKEIESKIPSSGLPDENGKVENHLHITADTLTDMLNEENNGN